MDDEINARLDHIENQLAGQGRFVYVPWSQRRSVPDEVVELARAGKKIEATRQYMRMMEVSLGEAKAAVEALGE